MGTTLAQTTLPRQIHMNDHNTNRFKLDFDQRARAVRLEDEICGAEEEYAAELIFSRDRLAKTEAALKLAEELCVAIGGGEEDIGGHRSIQTILSELGPAIDAACK